MRTARLGDHVAAWVVHDDDFGRDDHEQLAVTWTGPDGQEHAVPDPAADLVLDLHGEEYRIDHREGQLHVMGAGVVDQVPLRPGTGVQTLDAFRRDLVLVTTGGALQDDLVLVPSRRPGPLAVVDRWPHASGQLGREGPTLTLVDLTRPGQGEGVEPLAALAHVVDGDRCRFSAPPGLTTSETVFQHAGRTGTLTYLPELDVVTACLGETTIGGPVGGNLGQSFRVSGPDLELELRVAERDEAPAVTEDGVLVHEMPVGGESEVHLVLHGPTG